MKKEIQNTSEVIPIEIVLKDYLQLNKRGNNYLALCPFHKEKTPSFSVSPSKGIYKCFGIGQTGNILNFIMKLENLEHLRQYRKTSKGD